MTSHYGLIGYPLSHSFSQRYFTEKFAREGIDAVYDNYPISSIEQITDLLHQSTDLFGLNVTIPYKQAVIPYLDELSPEAKAIGAVNVIRIERQGNNVHLCGHNCDYIGFRESIEPTMRKLFGKHPNALILGTGGASKAVKYALDQMGVNSLFVSRKPQTSMLTYQDLNAEIMASYRLIVNTTPLGMSPNTDTFPDIPYSLLNEGFLLYDLVYNPLETRFLSIGKERGAHTLNGLDMLYLQAEATWKILK